MIQNIELEQNLLGCFLANKATYFDTMGMIDADDFSDPVHQAIFITMKKRFDADELVNASTLRDALSTHDGLNELGGAKYMQILAAAAVSLFAIREYAKALRKVARRRNLEELLISAQADLKDDTKGPGEVIGTIEASLMAVDDGNDDNVVSMSVAVERASVQANEAHMADGVVGVTTGLVDLDKMTGGFQSGELILLGGRPSMGKAQPLNSKIKTVNGWIYMGDAKVGQVVCSIDGGYSSITGVFPQGKKKIARVTFIDGRVVRCCYEHLWEVKSSKFKGDKIWDTKKIQDALLTERYKGRLSVPMFNGAFGSDQDCIMDAWLLGIMIGDGSLTHGAAFSTPDAEVLFRVQQTVSKYDDITVKHYGKYDFSISSPRGMENPILNQIKDLGLYNKRSEEKFIPQSYKSASYETRIELLQGLLDSDGWVEKFGSIRYASSSKRLALDIQELVWSIGGVCSMSEKPTSCLMSYVLNISHNSGIDLITLTKKKIRVNRIKPVNMTVVSVEDDGFEECQCISVSHHRQLYVTDGYIVTHNTAVALSLALSAARHGTGVAISSLEMTPESLALRCLSNEAATRGQGMAYTDAKRGTMSDEEALNFQSSIVNVAKLPIEILPSNMRDIGSIYAGVRKTARVLAGKGTPMGLIVIDYLQLISGQSKSRYELISEISIALKGLAMKFNVPVLALSQLSRALEQRDNKRPMLSDLRESGQLEQDADMVIFCYRGEYYLERDIPEKDDIDGMSEWQEVMDKCRGKLELIVAKQRMGEVGTVYVNFDAATNFLWDARY